MKVTVTKYLNVRVGSPSVNAPCYQYLAPGSEIEIDGKVYPGDPFENSTSWVKDLAGNYYWIGGVNAEAKDGKVVLKDGVMGVTEEAVKEEVKSGPYQQWMIDLGLPEIWKRVTGKGVGVAVVDTGIKSGIADLPFNKNHFVFDGTDNTEDTDGHGTYCAALIGKKTLNDSMIGVAPGCELFAAKISNTSFFDDNETDSLRYARAIDWCADQKAVHIISVSWGNPVGNVDTKNSIQDAINKAVKNGKIVVCAIGDATKYGQTTICFPACSDNTIGVGSIPVEKKVYPFINGHLSIVLCGDGIKSFTIDNFPYGDSGTSWSTAILAGLIALMIEKLAFDYSTNKILDILNKMTNTQAYTIKDTTYNLPTLNNKNLLNFFNL